MAAATSYEFGPYQLEAATRRLLRAGSPVALTPKAVDVLLALLERRDRVVDKAELMKLVWPDSFVEEANLSQTIFVLRKTLGLDANGRNYIDTIPRRGYRFAADVRETAPSESVLCTDTRGGVWRRIRWAAVAGVLFVVALAGWLRVRQHDLQADGKVVLAVLPFENLSRDPGQEYFSSGLTEEMITQLAALEPDRLAVIARTSAMQYMSTGKDARQIGRELGADYLLRGSVSRAEGRVRISAQLIQARDDRYVWAKDYDQELRDILTLQRDVSRGIAQEIRLKLTPFQSARLARASPVDPQAFENYLKGRFFWNKRTREGHERAIAFFEQAIAIDPTYPQAYAGLADAYALLGSLPNSMFPRSDAMTRAREAAKKALSLDESMADAHASLAFVKMHYDWEFRSAETEFQRAIALSPGYATAHQWYAYDLVALGRLEQAVAEMRRALQSDPLSLIINRDLAEMLLFAGRTDEAIAQCRKTLEMDPGFGLAHWTLAWAYRRKGQQTEFVDELSRVGGGSDIKALLAVMRGSQSDARRILGEMERSRVFNRSFEIATISVALGDYDRAFAAFERSLAERNGGFIIGRVDPAFDAIRGDPRFEALMRRVGLPPVTMARTAP